MVDEHKSVFNSSLVGGVTQDRFYSSNLVDSNIKIVSETSKVLKSFSLKFKNKLYTNADKLTKAPKLDLMCVGV